MVRASQIVKENPSANFSAAMGNSLIESYIRSPPDRVVDLMGKGKEFLGTDADKLWRKQQKTQVQAGPQSLSRSSMTMKQIQSSVMSSSMPTVVDFPAVQSQPVSLAISVATNPSLLSCIAPSPPPIPKMAEILAPTGSDAYCNAPGDVYAKLLKSSSKNVGISAGEALLALGAHIATASWGYDNELKGAGIFETIGSSKKNKTPNTSQLFDPRFSCICAVRAYLEREYRDSLESKKDETVDISGALNRPAGGGGNISSNSSGMGNYSTTNRLMWQQQFMRQGQHSGLGYMGYGSGYNNHMGVYGYGGLYSGVDGFGYGGVGIDNVMYNSTGNTFSAAEQRYPNGLRPMVSIPVIKGPGIISNITSTSVKQALTRLVLVHPQLLNVNMDVTSILQPVLVPAVIFILLRAGMRSEALKLIKSLVIGVNSFGKAGGALSGLTSGNGEEKTGYYGNDPVTLSGIRIDASSNTRTPVGLNSGHGIGPLLNFALQGFCKDPTRDAWDGSDTATSHNWYIGKKAKDNANTKSKVKRNVISTGVSSPTANNLISQSISLRRSNTSIGGMKDDNNIDAVSPSMRVTLGSGGEGKKIKEPSMTGSLYDEVYDYCEESEDEFGYIDGGYNPSNEELREKYRKSTSYQKNELSKALVQEFQNYKNTLTAIWSNNTASNSAVLGSSQVITGSNINSTAIINGVTINFGTSSTGTGSSGNKLGLSMSGSSVPNIETPIPALSSVAPCVRALHIYYLALLYTLTSRMCVSERPLLSNGTEYGQSNGSNINENPSMTGEQFESTLTPLLPALDTAAMDTGVGVSMGIGVMCIPSDSNSYQWFYSRGKPMGENGEGEMVPVASGSVLSLADYLWVRMSIIDEGRKDSRYSLRYREKLLRKVNERKMLSFTDGDNKSNYENYKRINNSTSRNGLNSIRNNANSFTNQNKTKYHPRTSLSALQAEIRSLPTGYFSNPHTQSGFNSLSSSSASGAMQLCACCLCSLQYQEAMYALVGSTPASSSTITAYSTARGQIVSHGVGIRGTGGILAECDGWLGIRSCNTSSLELAASLALILLSGRCREEEQIENLFSTFGMTNGASNENEQQIDISSNPSHPLTVPLGLLAPLMAIINSNAWSPHLIVAILLLIRGNIYENPDEYTRSALTILGALILAHSPDPLLGSLAPEFLGNEISTPGVMGASNISQHKVGDFVSAFYKHPMLNILSVKLSNGLIKTGESQVPRLNCEMFANALRIAAHWSGTGGGIPMSINSISGINSVINSITSSNFSNVRNYFPPVAACRFRAILLYALCTEADRLGLINNIDIPDGKVAFNLYGVIEVVSCDTTLLSMLCSLIADTLCSSFDSIVESINKTTGGYNGRSLVSNLSNRPGYSDGLTLATTRTLKTRSILISFADKVISVFKDTLASKRSEYVGMLISLTNALCSLDDYQRPGRKEYYGDIQLMFYRVYKSLLKGALRRSTQPNVSSATFNQLSGSVSTVSSAIVSLAPVVLKVLQSVVVVYKAVCSVNGGCVDGDGTGGDNTSDDFSVDRAYQILSGVMNIF